MQLTYHVLYAMSVLRSINSYDLSCLCLGSNGRSQSSLRNQQRFLAISTSKFKDGCSFLANTGGLSLLSIRPYSESTRNGKMDLAVHCGALPSSSDPGPWKSWVLGALIVAILPFCKQYWGILLPIKREVNKVVEGAEVAAEFVEKVATEVEKVADEIEDKLPEGAKAKAVVSIVEDIAKETAEDAELVEDIVQKVEELEHEVEEDIKSAITTPAATDKEHELKEDIKSAIAPAATDKENVVPNEKVKKD